MSAYGIFICLSLLVLYAFTHSALCFALAAIMLVCMIIFLINTDPYKKPMAHLTRNDTAFMILLTLVYVGITSSEADTNSNQLDYHNIGLIVHGVTRIEVTLTNTYKHVC